MAIIKCKMCGGDLILNEGNTIATCEYCGSTQTVPSADNEKKLTLFARANRLRIACEFDKAAGIYESIVADFPEEAESYWGLVLCRYGIEYVDDPGTGKKIPTCHRSSFDSIMEDSDFEQALENADLLARRVYREEAKQIEELRKGIIAVSNNEPPYDIFICYKETDETGSRTLDSVLAQDVYEALTDKGYRVFFSRITLEDKLGVEYEPYIFAALNSAKIMLAFGTDYEYFNAVWVKNEWSRYLKLMAKDKEKHLIPCFKGIDAYDMPKEFARLQAQDLGKIGAVQDLLRGIAKLMPKQEKEAVVVQTATPNASAMVMRGQFALEDGDFKQAGEYFERALDQNPQDGAAYLGKVLAALHLSKASQIDEYLVKLHDDKDYDRAIRFSDPATAQMLRDIRERAHKKYLVKCVTVGIKKYARNREREERVLAERIAQQKREEEERLAQQKREEEERERKKKRLEEEAKRKPQVLQAIRVKCGIPDLVQKIDALSGAIREVQERIPQLNKELEALKFYQIGEKSRLTKQLNNLEEEIKKRKTLLEQTEYDLVKAKATFENISKNYSKWHEIGIRDYSDNWQHFMNDLQPILEYLEHNPVQMFTAEEILRVHPRGDLTERMVTGFLNEDRNRRFIRREMVKGKAYYQFAGWE